MPEHVLPEEPLNFLVRHGENPNILETFVHPGAVKVIKVTKTDFIRGAGGGNNPAGKWWMRTDTLAQIMTRVQALPEWPNERRNLLQREIRNQTAVSVNWNSFSAFGGCTSRPSRSKACVVRASSSPSGIRVPTVLCRPRSATPPSARCRGAASSTSSRKSPVRCTTTVPREDGPSDGPSGNAIRHVNLSQAGSFARRRCIHADLPKRE